MLFWIIIGAMALVAAAILGSSILRERAAAEPAASFDLDVYRDQLAEVDRDLARGVLGEQDADRVRTEISRRILAADAAIRAGGRKTRALGSGPLWISGVTLVLVAGSGWLYMQLGAPGYGDLGLATRIELAEEARASRPTQAQAEASIDPATLPQPSDIDDSYRQMVAQLREVLASRPDDLRGWRLLALSERNLGQYAASAKAQERVVSLAGTDVKSRDYSDLANALVLAAGGYVSPEAEVALTRALELDPGNGAARYYWGLMMAQIGRADQAFRIWDSLLRQGPPEAPWIGPILAQIREAAFRAGVDYTVPQPGPQPGGGLPGPSADDIEAAGEMSAADRMEMIEGMVSGLSDRLASEGGSANEWARLITALGVLGRTDEAARIYREATGVFAADPGAMDRINRAGERAGVTN